MYNIGPFRAEARGSAAKNTWNPWKSDAGRPWLPCQATSTAIHSDLRLMPRTASLLLESPCGGSVAHVTQRSTSLGRSTMRWCISPPSFQKPWFRWATGTVPALHEIGSFRGSVQNLLKPDPDLLRICSFRHGALAGLLRLFVPGWLLLCKA